MPFFFKKKRIIAARTLCYEAQIYYDMAVQSDNLFLFLDYWNTMKERITELRTYENRIPKEIYDELSLIELKENDFQWKMRDAIERAQNSAISDLKTEYRNNKQNRYIIFANDINRGKPYFSKETADFASSAVSTIAAIAGVGIQADSNGNGSVLTQDIDSMDGAQFELWCKNLLSRIGYQEVSLTGKSGDQGVDLLAKKDGISYAIQCKCYSSDLGNTPVQEVNTGKVIYNCHVGAVMTNRRFTAGGIEAAKATGVLLWDRDWIVNHIKHNSFVDEAVENVDHSSPIEENLNSYNTQSIDDAFFPVAVEIILETQQASVSILQRRLKLGYARSARIIDMMESLGFIGPFCGSKPREILISKSQWNTIKPVLFDKKEQCDEYF